jgi:hypothetical protein
LGCIALHFLVSIKGGETKSIWLYDGAWILHLECCYEGIYNVAWLLPPKSFPSFSVTLDKELCVLTIHK